MYGDVGNMKVGKTLLANWRHNLAQNKEYLLRKNPHGTAAGIIVVRAWGNPGSTRSLQRLLLLFFVAWGTRLVGARFDGEPSDGNDKSALGQRKVLRRQNRESTEIT